MATCPLSTASVFQSVLSVWKDWQISVLMLVTMWLQLLLVVAGGFRKQSAHKILHVVVWFSFIGIDSIAMYALGLMLGENCDTVFSLWAPILLFHLGVADSITAYSSADNDLWKRHGFKMSLEVLAAAYIISRSACRRYLFIGFLLFAVGAIKYTERISALKSGSGAQIMETTHPIYRFMAVHEEENVHTHPLIVVGEEEWYADHLQATDISSPRALKSFDAVVTYDEIKNNRELRKLTLGYLAEICLAYALYKIYRRRLINLRLHQKEDDHEKVRGLFFSKELPPKKIIRVIDLELSFLYDSLFTKAAGAAYTGIGVFFRLTSVALLIGAVVFLIIVELMRLGCNDSTVHLGGILTHVLVAVALVLETLQIYRLVKSNWTRMWLATQYVKEKRRSTGASWSPLHKVCAEVILFAIPFVGIPRQVHWQNEIGHFSILNSCLDEIKLLFLGCCKLRRLRAASKMQKLLENLNLVSSYELELFLLEQMEERLKDLGPANFSQIKNRISSIVERTLGQYAPEFSWASNSGLERTLLNWHIATSICEVSFVQEEKEDPENSTHLEEYRDAYMSISLSRYAMYLMVKRPKLLPGDPDATKWNYERVKQKLKQVLLQHSHDMNAALLQVYKPSSEDPENLRRTWVDAGIVLGRRLLIKPALERWQLLADVWSDMLMIIAISENAHPHTRQISKGGELLTHLWVLLGHMGYGQIS